MFSILLLLKLSFVRFKLEISIDSKLLSEISIIFNLGLYDNSISDNKLLFKFSFSRSRFSEISISSIKFFEKLASLRLVFLNRSIDLIRLFSKFKLSRDIKSSIPVVSIIPLSFKSTIVIEDILFVKT